MVCYQTEDTAVEPKEPLKLKPEMFCIRCKPYRKIRKNDGSCCQTENAAVAPDEHDENPGESAENTDEDPLEPSRYMRLSNPPLYKYKVKKTGVIFISKEKDRKKAYEEFLLTENAAVAPDEPDENPGEPDENTDEDPLEPGCYHLYKYKVKKTGVIFISKEKDRKKAYEEFLRTKRW